MSAGPCYSKCVLTRNAISVPTQTHWIRSCVLTRSPGDVDAHESLKSTGLSYILLDFSNLMGVTRIIWWSRMGSLGKGTFLSYSFVNDSHGEVDLGTTTGLLLPIYRLTHYLIFKRMAPGSPRKKVIQFYAQSCEHAINEVTNKLTESNRLPAQKHSTGCWWVLGSPEEVPSSH